MLQRAASNAYSWWRASHIRTRQSKWLDSNLEEMESTVKNMLKLIEPDADSFAKRAELYFKRRPELISFVEDAYRAYRALAERYDHISGELHKANHIIATSFPERVQYAMLEDDDSMPKAITPINPSKINKRTVEGLMNKKKEKKSSKKKPKKKGASSPIDKETAREEINKLQKGILVLQTEKEFIKSSYESGIAKYWDIEKRIMEMHEEVCRLQEEFNTSAVIEDNDARVLMTQTVLKSCEDTIVKLQEQRKKALEEAKVESDRTKTAKEKLKALGDESCQTEMKNSELPKENTEMSFAAENVEEEVYSLQKTRTELQSICEKIKGHFEMNPESSVIEIAEKIEELANKFITMELTVSSQTVQIKSLNAENDEFEKCIESLEKEKPTLSNDAGELSKRLKEAGDEFCRVQAIEKIVQNEETNFRENFSETWHDLNVISEMLQSHPSQNNACIGDASTEEEISIDTDSQQECKDKEVTEIHENKEIASKNEEDPTKKIALGEKESSQVDLNLHIISNGESILDAAEGTIKLQQLIQSGLEGKEKILLAEYTSVLQNYNDTKRKLSEVEKKNEDYLQETKALVGELKNDIAMKDEEIRLLRQPMKSVKESSRELGELKNDDTKRKLSEVEKKNEEYLQETKALVGELGELKNDIAMKDEEIRLLRQPMESVKESSTELGKLKNDIAMKDEEIRLLRQPMESVKESSTDTCEAPVERQKSRKKKLERASNSAMAAPVEPQRKKLERASNSAMAAWKSDAQDSKMVEDLDTKPAKRNSSVEKKDAECTLAEGTRTDQPKSISPLEEKFRREIDTLLDERLEFWLKFSTSFHQVQEFKDKYEDLQADISKLKDNKSQECTDSVCEQAGKPESAEITKSLRELKTELHVWLEQGALLKEDLQNRFSSLCDMQEEIASVLNTDSESGEMLFTPYEVAIFQGEVRNMKMDNNKVANELQAGLDQVMGLHAEIEGQLSTIYTSFGSWASKGLANDCYEVSPGKTNVPLRDFLFGVKPKKTSILARIQQGKLRAGRRKMDY